MKKQQGTCTTCFSGHNLSRKGKTQNKKSKTIQNPKKLKASHFAVETVGISIGVSWLSQGEGKRDSRASLQAASGRTTKGKEKRVAGAQTSASSEKGMGGVFQTFSAVENSEKQKLINNMRSPQAPKLCQQNVFRSLKDFSDIFYFIVYFKAVFKTKHTEEESLEADWLCVHKDTNTTRHVLVGLL